MSTNEINQSLDAGRRLVGADHKRRQKLQSSLHLQGEHGPHGLLGPHGCDGTDAQNTIVPRFAIGVVAIIYIAAVGAPRSEELAGVLVGSGALVDVLLHVDLVGAGALVEVLLHVDLEKNGVLVRNDGAHGSRCTSMANTGHKFDENVED